MLAVPVHNVDRTFGFGRQLQFLFLKFKRRSFMGRELVSWSASNRSRLHFFRGLERTAVSSVVRASSNGAVAQLGERLICIQEVAGSIPTSSTKLSCSGPEKQANAATKLPGAHSGFLSVVRGQKMGL